MRLCSTAAGSAQGDAARCGQEPCRKSAPGLTGPTDCRQTRTQELAQQRQHCAVTRRDAALWRRRQRRRPRRRRRAARRPLGRPWRGRGEDGGVQRARRAGRTPQLVQDVWRARADAKLGKAAMPRMHSCMMCGMHHVESARAQPTTPLPESCTLESKRLHAAPAHMQLSATRLLALSRLAIQRHSFTVALELPRAPISDHVGQAQNMTGNKLGAHGRQGGPSWPRSAPCGRCAGAAASRPRARPSRAARAGMRACLPRAGRPRPCRRARGRRRRFRQGGGWRRGRLLVHKHVRQAARQGHAACPPRCQSPRLLPDRHPHSPVGMPGSPALQGALRRRPGGHDHSTRQLRSQPHCLLVLHRLPRAAARGRPMPPRGRRERPRRAGAPPAAAASSTAAPRAAYPCRARAQVHASTALSRASVTSVTPWLIRRSKLTSACHSV